MTDRPALHDAVAQDQYQRLVGVVGRAAVAIAAALLVLLSTAPVLAPNGLPAGWEPLDFPKIKAHTAYEWSPASGTVHARAAASASDVFARFVQRWSG